MTAFASLEAAVGSLKGRRTSSVRPGVGSFLLVDLVSEFDETLWIRHASWRVLKGGSVVGGSSDEQLGMDRAAEELMDKEIASVAVNSVFDLVLRLSDGTTLDIFNTMSDRDFDLWSLFLRENVISAGSDGQISEESKSR